MHKLQLIAFIAAAFCGTISAQENSRAMSAGAAVRQADEKSRPAIEKSLDPAPFRTPAPESDSLEAEAERAEEKIRVDVGGGFSVSRWEMFIIATDVAGDEADRLSRKVLAPCALALRRQFFTSAPPKPVAVYAFRDAQSYEYNLSRLFKEKPISPYGHYSYASRRIIFNHHTGLGTMSHELVHALMDADMPSAPIWIAEGMASLYEQCSLDNQRISGLVNWRLPELQQKIDTADNIPMAALLAADDAAFKLANESLHYAQARYFCLYLEQKGLLSEVYKKFRDGYTRDATGKIFIEESFGQSIDKVEEDFKAWVKSLAVLPSVSTAASTGK